MSKIFDLIKRLCPQGVEFRELGDIADIVRGQRVTKAELQNDGKYPVVSGGIKPLGFLNRFNREANTITVAQYGTAGYINFIEEKFWANDVCYCIFSKKEISNKFLLYCLMKNQGFIYSLRTNAIPAHLPQKLLSEIKLPVPPLEVQREIVRILDCFTLLTAELTAELTARKKQYEFYCNFLLNFDDSVDFKELGKVLVIKNGKDYKNFGTGNIPVYGSGGIMTYIDTFLFNKPSVLIPRKGSLQNLFYLDEPFWNVDTIFYTDINCDIVIPKFVYYFLKTQNLERLNNAGGVPSLTQGVLNKLKIPIPSLPTQRKIVEVLDKFDTLVNSISDGLPREIELRRKQYEYYRDLLLNFKEKSA
nr:restriction endonuclease subunit S [uncultured Campylobacter sp.]